MTELVSGQAAKQVLERLQRSSPVPLGVHLQISDRCNHSCAHCYQIQGNKGELSTAEWVGVLERLAKAGVLFLTVSGGEPTLRPDLLELLQVAVRLGFSVRLFTNGYLIDAGMADRLAELHLFAIHVSVYSHLAEEHDAVTKVSRSWKQATRAIRDLVARGANVVVNWPSLATSSSTYAEIEELCRVLRARLGACNLIKAREDGSPETTSRMMRTGDHLAAGLCAMPLVAHNKRDLLARPVCGACSTIVAVIPNGLIWPCIAIRRALGNALTDNLRAAVLLEEYRFIGGLTWGHLHGCRDCDLIGYCMRCHADAYAQTGDMLGPYESACRHARAQFSHHFTVNLGGCVPKIGPYRQSEGRLEQLPDKLCDSDETIRIRFPWVLRSQDEDFLARPCPGC